ncbi:MAG TPA: c-type cytochrome [Stellaceae bacterium]|nr:c-type cytochrome [Stellaceae bacterium]
MTARAIIMAAAIAAGLGPAGAARAAGDVASGHALARQWCMSCHVVEDGGPGPDTAPPFAAVARRHAGDRSWVRAWLTSPHPPMPNFNLARQQIEDIIAYLDSLAPR